MQHPLSVMPTLRHAQVYSHVKQLANSFKHPQNASLQMYYSVSWDWRRDLWSESERVVKALRRIHKLTACKAILVGHSFGANLIYAALAVRSQSHALRTERIQDYCELG
jgi:pimeloyl-ACP methyl ester carboxylesterase